MKNSESLPEILTRLFITREGDILVTDLWRELALQLAKEGDFDEIDTDL